MKIIHTKHSEFITSKWTGGTSTQLAIYPQQATYQKADFLFRLSSAKVELEESWFTKLPGVTRKIMVLEGILRLEHSGHYTSTLCKFESDTFMGDWETKSFGCVTDFNLMTTGKTSGTLEGFYYKKGSEIPFQFQKNFLVAGIYVYKGSIKINSMQIEEGDIVMIWKESDEQSTSIFAVLDSELVFVNIAL